MMSNSIRSGTWIAHPLRGDSAQCQVETSTFSTVGQLLDILRADPPSEFPVLKTTCARVADYLGLTIDRMTIDLVNDTKTGFREYLDGRRYKENAIRSYVNHVRILLRHAETLGWKPNQVVPYAWVRIMQHAKASRCPNLLKNLSTRWPDPRSVTAEDVDRWTDDAVKQGLNYRRARQERMGFWRLLYECGELNEIPIFLRREEKKSFRLDELPGPIRQEYDRLMDWKLAPFTAGRAKEARLRPITAKQLGKSIRCLYYFVSTIIGRADISSLIQLIDKDLFGSYLEWCINVRKINGYSLRCEMRLLFAAVRQYPGFSGVDVSWWEVLHDSIPIEEDSEKRRRKAEKYLEYEVLELIPDRIRSLNTESAHLGAQDRAELVMHELLIRWLLALPWRQKNIRECRIHGNAPNLFKGRIPTFSEIDKPLWVRQEEERNPHSEFWQFTFSPDETKTKHRIQAILPRPLIPLLEDYLRIHRRQLVFRSDPGTLFLDSSGAPLTEAQVADLVSALTLRHGGRRVTPHLFRDIFAFTWLKEHSKDYLTLSKILWHSNINTTIDTYGSRFNESSGVCASEIWIEERERRSKSK